MSLAPRPSIDPDALPLTDPSRESFFDLRRYLLLVRNRKWLILTVAAATVAGALLFSLLRTPTYESSAQMLVPPIEIDSGPQATAPLSLETEAAIVRSTQVAVLAGELMDTSGDPGELLEHVGVEIPPDTQSIVISYSDPDPGTAQQGANAFARAFLDVRRQQALDEVNRLGASYLEEIEALEEDLAEAAQTMAETPQLSAEWRNAQSLRYLIREQISGLRGRLSLLRLTDLDPGSVIVQASRPGSPAGPGPLLVTVSGLLLGLFLGVVVAFFRDRIDERLRGRIDVQAVAGAPVLAVIPEVREWTDPSSARLITLDEPQSPSAEAYRTLGASVLILTRRLDQALSEHQRRPRILLVVSPLQGEGKSTTVANLGAELTQAGTRMVLISADLRNPRLHDFFELPNDRGLSSMLTGEVESWEMDEASGIGDLSIVASGPPIERPAEALQSQRMRSLLEEARQRADLVLIDGPPLLPVADSLVLASYVDGVLLVVDGQRTKRTALVQARGALEQIGADVVGVVLNNVDPSRVAADYAAYGYYGPAWKQSTGADLDGEVPSDSLFPREPPARSSGSHRYG